MKIEETDAQIGYEKTIEVSPVKTMGDKFDEGTPVRNYDVAVSQQ